MKARVFYFKEVFMENIYFQLFFFTFVFLLVFTIYFIYLKIKVKNNKKIMELEIMIKQHKLNRAWINYNIQVIFVSIINALIIAFVTSFVSLFEMNYGIQMALAFVFLLGLIYSLYELYGRILKYAQKKKRDD